MTDDTAAGIVRAAGAVALVTAVARAVGFLRVVVFAHAVGPSCLGDVYYTANTIPNIVFDVVAGGALSSAVVPLLAGPVAAGDDETADRIASGLLGRTLLVLVPVVALGVVFAGPVVGALLGHGGHGCPAAAEHAVGARMLRVFMPQVLLYGAAVVLIGVLQAHRRFLGPAVAPLLSSAVVIATYGLFAAIATRGETSLSTSRPGDEYLLAVGTTLGVAALALPLLLPVRRAGRRLRPTLALPPGVGRRALALGASGVAVLASQDLATAGILRLANARGSVGTVVVFNLAWTVFLLPWAVLAVPLATTAFPTLAAQWDAARRADYAETLARANRSVLLVAAGAVALTVAAAGPAARVLVLGAPGPAASGALAAALRAFAPGLVGYAAVALLTRACYARGDVRSPAVAAAGGWAVVLVADLALVAVAGTATNLAVLLGVGSSIGLSCAGLGLHLQQRRAVGAAATRGLPRTAVAAAAAAVPAAAAGLAVARLVPQPGVAGSAVAALAVTAAVAAVFVAVLHPLEPEPVRFLLRRVRGAA